MELAITTTASIAYLLQSSGEQVGMLTNAFDAAVVAKFDIESTQVVSREDLAAAIVGDTISDAIKPLLVPTMKSPAQARKIAENLARVIPGKGLEVNALLMASAIRFPTPSNRSSCPP